MINRINITAGLLLSVNLLLHAAQPTPDKGSPTKDLWVINVKLDVPALEPHAVVHTFCDYDPVPRFRNNVATMSSFYKERIEQAADRESGEKIRRAGMTSNWNRVFEGVTGDQVGLLTDKTSYASNAPAPGKKWIVTKATVLDGEPASWCVSVQPVIGREVDVVLNRDNRFELAKTFDEAMRIGLEKLAEKPPEFHADAQFRNDPNAHAMYDRMLKEIQKAKTLYYESEYSFGRGGFTPAYASYKMWLKKPNVVRMEAYQNNRLAGTLIGDGQYFWIHWGDDDSVSDKDGMRAHANTNYLKLPSPAEHHSIAHMAGKLKADISMTIWQPSTFHRCRDGLDDYIDGVRSRGTETIDGEECDVIEVSYMDNQRSKYYSLARSDHLPRKLKEIVRVENVLVAQETWRNVFANVTIPESRFTWQPPEGWTEYIEPNPAAGLLNPGSVAPDFDFNLTEGKRFKLSDQHGKVVLIYFWRAG